MTDDKRKKCMSQWSDVPPELLSPIAESLDLTNLLGFRGVCKSWKSASNTASAQSSAKPWFLLYGENNNSECQLLSQSNEKYTISLPELVGATCIASDQGWSLVLQESSGSTFFFCPFSREKIELPSFPAAQLTDHIAAFSSPPTSQDCIVCIISRISNDACNWELNLLRRGANEWTKHNYSGEIGKINAIQCAAYHKGDGEFYFFDPDDKLLTFSTENIGWHCFDIVYPGTPDTESIVYTPCRNVFYEQKLKNKFEIAENVSLSICGTELQGGRLIIRESITFNVAEDQSKRRQIKGVWIHPRFHQISSNNQSW